MILVRKFFLLYLSLIGIKAASAQSEIEPKYEFGVNAISIIRGGNNAGLLFKIHNNTKQSALRFGISGASSIQKGKLINLNLDNPIPEDFNKFTNSNNNFTVTMGRQVKLASNQNFLVYHFLDLALGTTLANTTSSQYSTKNLNNGMWHMYEFTRDNKLSKTYSASLLPGIGAAYRFKRFSIFLETSLGFGFNHTESQLKTKWVDYNSFTNEYSVTQSSSYSTGNSNNINLGFSPYTVLYFSYFW